MLTVLIPGFTNLLTKISFASCLIRLHKDSECNRVCSAKLISYGQCNLAIAGLFKDMLHNCTCCNLASAEIPGILDNFNVGFGPGGVEDACFS